MKRCCWVVLVLGWGCQGERGTGELLRTSALENSQVKAAGIESVAPGIVVEKMPEGSAPGKAGIRPGDILLSWKRLRNPPINPEPAEGEFGSPFDWHELRIEQAPRGAVAILGEREGMEKTWKIEPGSWRDVEVQPRWIGHHLELFLQGQQQIKDGNLEDGAKAWQKLVDWLGREDEDRQRLWVLFGLARFWLGDGREQPQAPEKTERTLKLLKTQKIHKLESAYVQQELGEVLENRGELDRARDLYTQALKTRQQLTPQSLTVADSLNDLGIVAYYSGDLDQAHAFYSNALQINEQLAPASLQISASLNNLGGVAWMRGDLDQTQKFFSRALRLSDQLAPGSFQVAGGLNNLGLLARDRGDLDQAHELHSRALRINQQLAPESLAVSANLNNLGAVAADRGDLDQSWEFFSHALRIDEQLAPESLLVAGSLTNLGIQAWVRGDLDRAQGLHSRALLLLQRLAPGSLNEASSLNSLGKVAMDLGDLSRAQDFYNRALRIHEKLSPDSLALATSLIDLGEIANGRGDLVQAYELYNRALQIYHHLAPQSQFTANSFNHLADLALAEGDSVRAASYYLQTLEVLEQQIKNLGGSYNVQANFRTQQRELYWDALELLLAQGHLADSFHILERFRARTFLTMLAERDIVFTADLSETLDRERRRFAVRHDRTLKRLAELSAHDDKEEVATIRQELKAMDQERGEIEDRIRRASPRLAALQYPQPLTSEEAQRVLDPGTLLVSYVVGGEFTSVFALSREEALEVKTIPVGEAALRKEIENLRDLIPEAIPDTQLGQDRTRSLQILSRELYQLLLEPLAERVEKSERLLILPDGPLHALPFAALIHEKKDDDGTSDYKNNQYLVEWKPLHIALSVTTYAELKKARPPAHEPGTAPMQLAAFGDPSYPEAFTLATVEARADALPQDAVLRSVSQREGSDFEWRPLPYTRREVQGIVEFFPQAQVFLGPEALEERVKNLGPGVRILHLAAHAFTDDRIPLNSFVALTIPEDLPEGLDNGLLQAWEILEQVRIDADLVVLSGCLTGMGKELRGEGLIGLTRAFQYAGARSMMSTLWSVSDQATAELMIRFYRHLRSGLPKDEALRAAQLELLREPIVSVDENGQPQELEYASAPFYWAGVQLYGDWM